MENRSGIYMKQLRGEMEYRTFRPIPLQEVSLREMDSDFYSLLTRTARSLGRLDGISSRIPDISLFVSMYIRKEALMSSQIEGTQATLDDILDPEAEDNQNVDVADVLNYIRAADYAMERLKELSLCNRLLKETHAILLSGIRGSEKNLGEFRRSQNWIGSAGGTIKNASFIPPSPDDMEDSMSELEKYINEADDSLDILIQAALIHYQFETIHPFMDGNGRIGRLLILLFLYQRGALPQPVLYISYFLKQNRIEYYDRLMEVRRKGNYEQWVRFFIETLYQASEDATLTIDRLVTLRDQNRAAIDSVGRSSKSVKKIFDYIERSPIIDIRKTSVELRMPYSTVSRAVEKLCTLQILQQTETVKRNRCFAYEEYLSILRKDT